MMSAQIDRVLVDSRETHERLLRFAGQFMPDLAGRIEHYAGERPLFDLNGVEDEISRALRSPCRSSRVATSWSTRPRR